MAAGSSEKPIAVYGAIIANAAIAVTKFVAAYFTGSSSMISEGIHSVVDTGNQSLLLLGLRRAKRPADANHPFGHGKELYFWGLIVAVILFGVGGGMSIYEGITHLQHPSEITNPIWNYVTLGAAMVFESISFVIAIREFLKGIGEESIRTALRTSKDPAIFVVLFEDAAALTGLVIAFVGILLGQVFENPLFDGLASILIGIMLAVVSVYLAVESRALLIGESARSPMVEGIYRIVREDPAVKHAERPLTMHFGPREILVNISIVFEQQSSSTELVNVVDRIEKKIQTVYPDVRHIFIEADALIQTETASTDTKQADTPAQADK